nr:hypothetical protein [Mycolicibacterium sp.]
MSDVRPAAEGLLGAQHETTVRLLSSYNNNSNNPQRGTDLLRGAW